MKVANLAGRLVLLAGERALDVERASGGRFAADPQAAFAEWDALVDWARSADLGAAQPFAEADLGPPVPRPGQVFGIGLNYRDHAEEASIPIPSELSVFTKFASCITAPFATVELPTEHVDYEVELVLVIGRAGHRVRAADAWSHVAGVTIGQDLSERDVQLRPPVPQFSLGKSFPGFGPIGPAIVTLDELRDPDDLELGCRIGDEELQRSRTSKMLFPVPDMIERLTSIVPIRPGDVIFTGTPAGVGFGRKPPRWLRPGDELESWIEGVGTIRQRFT